MQQAVIFARIIQEDPAARQQLEGMRLIGQHFTQQQELQVVAEIIDTSPLGATQPQRKGIQQLLDLCRQRMVQKVLVSNITHLASTRIDLAQLVEELTQLGISIYMHNYGLETLVAGSPNLGVLNAIQALAQEVYSERAEHRERIMQGLAKAKRQGKRLGRPVGSTEDRGAYLKKHAAVVRQLRLGLSVRKTAKLCNVAAKTVSKVKALL
jgi:DNA invertase Pin-like site-specific DNA recombinase